MIKLSHVDKQYQNHHALNDVSVEFPDHQTTVILGPSGAGKSTLLRAINLLERPQSGTLEIGDSKLDYAQDLSNKEILQMRRQTAMVFQSWNLFPNLTILENITEGPIYVKGVSRATAEKKAHQLLQQVGLDDVANRYPNQLSGGQQQRVSICRALALDTSFILFDEPTSALDPELEAQILRVLQDLAKQGHSMIVVTHNMDFARKVADQIVFVEDGQIEFAGASEQFFNQPTKRIQEFLAAMKF
ncbi:glutamate ABC transporter, ATP-binding protein GluA [Limosilactobacillus coleohominis 101-4-CHN]|uniref:Glutamate ABC transporter, ATP-binding protein GluA n=1 Tax=Limosilactobacillus coleohominis 101-4-CHN TaxID=575594 RepID=C7XXQ2_9LACO|nr:amino acid ABC transporter ATP-binding protein [Limosilactobacillus coleohominis]EEU29672.1 glutamate ABC transporter, ATP-binding protein GluA [Limosilactobacillus coleohominis 101-4-CHN]